MAVPVVAARCPSCRARVRPAEPAAAEPVRSGPVAAEAWARVRRDSEWWEGEREPGGRRSWFWGDVHDARPVGPGAAAALVGLRLVELAALVVVGVDLARAALSLAVDDPEELGRLGWWGVLADLSTIAVIAVIGTVVAAAVLLVRWAAAAGHNLRVLALDPRRWVRSGERVAGRGALVVALLLAWVIAPSGPGRVDRAVDLGLGVCAAVALVLLAAAAQRLLVAVTTTELHRAELLARIESAAAARPRHR